MLVAKPGTVYRTLQLSGSHDVCTVLQLVLSVMLLVKLQAVCRTQALLQTRQDRGLFIL